MGVVRGPGSARSANLGLDVLVYGAESPVTKSVGTARVITGSVRSRREDGRRSTANVYGKEATLHTFVVRDKLVGCAIGHGARRVS